MRRLLDPALIRKLLEPEESEVYKKQPLHYDRGMKLYLARHTLTNYNEKDICNGDPAIDVHLTSTGITQAKGLAQNLEAVRFDHIFVSQFKRTQQTAEIINALHGLKIEVDPRLNDIRSEFEGKPYKDYVKALHAADNKWTVRFNGGESIEDMKKRAIDFVDNLRTKDFKTVLVVTSEWVIRAMLTHIQNLSNEEAWDMAMTQGEYIEVEL